MCVVYIVVKQGDRWVIEDIDLADPNGLSDEISDLQAEPDQDESTQPSKKGHLPGADKTSWGPAVEGVQCRVRAEKPTWPQGTVPKVFADLRNQGKRNLRIALEHESWELEIDGKWHEIDFGVSGDRNYLPLGPGGQQEDLEVWILADGTLPRKLRALPLGKHTLRVARLLNSSRAPGEEILRLVSNPIEIEIVPAEPATGSGVSGEVKLSPRKLFSASHGEDVSALAVAFSPIDNLLAIGAEDTKHVFLTVWEIGEP